MSCSGCGVLYYISYNMFANDMMFILDDDINIYNYVDDNSLLCGPTALSWDLILPSKETGEQDLSG